MLLERYAHSGFLNTVCLYFIFYMYAHQLSSGFDRNSRAMFS